MIVGDLVSRAKKNVAARNAATPTRETGATTASNLAGGSALPLISSSRGYQVKLTPPPPPRAWATNDARTAATSTTDANFAFH
jgi:hypothetical protein